MVGLDYRILFRFAREFAVPLTPALLVKIGALERATLAALQPKGGGDEGRSQEC